MKQTPHLSKTANRVITTLMAFSCLSSIAAPAWAARDDWRKHATDAREWHHRHLHNGRIVYDNGEPDVTFAPPLVVEPPPASGLNIVVPLNIR